MTFVSKVRFNGVVRDDVWQSASETAVLSYARSIVNSWTNTFNKGTDHRNQDKCCNKLKFA